MSEAGAVGGPVPSPERLVSLIEGMAGRPVLLVADLVADRFIRGTPKRISREAPVLILGVESDELVPGGGANAVANVAALGGRPIPVGAVGDDASGRGLVDQLEAQGIPTEGIARLDGYRTPTKTRVLGGARHALKQQIVRFDAEDSLGERREVDERLERVLAVHGRDVGVAVLSDYGYGAAHPRQVALLRDGLGDGAAILCDSRYQLARFAGIDGATPNEEEAEAMAGDSFEDDPAVVAAAGRRMLEALAARFLLITRGSRGMSLVLPEGAAHVPIHGTDQVADVTGAGDTVIGAFSLALAAGASPLEAALVANYAGGVVVQKAGTATLTPAELEAAVTTDPLPLRNLHRTPHE